MVLEFFGTCVRRVETVDGRSVSVCGTADGGIPPASTRSALRLTELQMHFASRISWTAAILRLSLET